MRREGKEVSFSTSSCSRRGTRTNEDYNRTDPQSFLSMAVHLGSAPSSKERPSCSNSSENTCPTTNKMKIEERGVGARGEWMEYNPIRRRDGNEGGALCPLSSSHQLVLSRILAVARRRGQKLLWGVRIDPPRVASSSSHGRCEDRAKERRRRRSRRE